MTLDSLCQAVALVGARLAGDTEGERVLLGDCGPQCRPLVEGLVAFAELAVRVMAGHDQVTPEQAAEQVAQMLRSLATGEAR